MADEDVARLVSLGYAEAMARVALKNEESLEQAAEALAANNGTYQRQVGVVTFEIQWCGRVSTTYFIPASKNQKNSLRILTSCQHRTGTLKVIQKLRRKKTNFGSGASDEIANSGSAR